MASSRCGKPREEPAFEDPADLMGTLQEIAFAIWEQAAAANCIMEWMERQPEVHNDRNAGGIEIDLEYLKFAKFRKTNLPTF